MRGTASTDYSESDIIFLVETTSPALLSRIETIRSDPDIVNRMMENETRRLFERIMLMHRDALTTAVSTRFLFEVLLRAARLDMETQAYTVERTANQKIPVFDAPQVVRFLGDSDILKYLADMLASFNRIESFTLPVRVRRGIRRRVRFNDMDIDSLIRFCEAIDEERRFAFYKRIADLCLFIPGMFPEYVTVDYRHPSGGKVVPRLFGRLRRSAADYTDEGRRFYKLAGGHQDASVLGMNGVLQQIHDNFLLAGKPLNYISEHYVRFTRDSLFSHSS